ncbi:helix-turn-helix domain-containing protein [Corynebacterium uberis]|uniref:helix-turn-helix domain-containing protein n=1 Tax=Corynebacterium TaxID=1716 RepID=UPI001D0A0F59|nr:MULTISPECIES: helix-turn-helix domain-containing protein [Corynebacterium]MCZ9309846.1 helix-turn-helix domain-containing protein [Corynebacterium sp. c6VSa_13]UDL73227.1 helix-turn-helix domain-containing protein [Corynebacterium uberis]UDL75896.1 helix-turn-helix domain-containing protein [Corynebacterium uberis]UDL78108.1 helix-turn-helix domain-containing protein [Corynebacterium uberis]UDL80391.1 helix-turn-helix domain-containing protein [Corynebacterium uberis]
MTQNLLVTAQQERSAAAFMSGDRQGDVGNEVMVPLPPDLEHIVRDVVAAIARGESITISPTPRELTTTMAAKQLGISRPTLMKHIRAGDIPFRKVGSHYRVLTEDVQAFAEEDRNRRRNAVCDGLDLHEEMVAREIR